MKHVAIIGGGIAGLTAAYYLKKCNIDVTVIERQPFVGGAIRTDLKNERYLLEYGPNAFLSSSKPIKELSHELGIDHQIVANQVASKKRYIFRNGHLHPLPKNPKEFLASPILSRLAKMRVLSEPFIRSKSDGHETLAEFVIRRGGKEILESMVDPYVSGVYAGDPYQLEMKSVLPRLLEVEEKYGSIFKGMRHLKGELASTLMSYNWGMETLPARIYDLLQKNIETDTTAEAIEPLPDGGWVVWLDTYKEKVEADAVVIAAPASEAARLLMPLLPEIFTPLVNISYVSLAVVHTVFRNKDVPCLLDGFGFLIPRLEKIRLLGSIWSSTLFPNRAPAGEIILTNFIGGAGDPSVIDLDDHELLTHISAGLEKTMGLCREPCFYHIHRINQAIPQYTVGHRRRLKEINNYLKKLPGIFLAGSYFTGISVSDTIEQAKDTAISMGRYLASLTSVKKKPLDTSRDAHDDRVDPLHTQSGAKQYRGVGKIDKPME